MTLDQALNQRCTYVNKRKKKRKHVGVMKEYRQVPAAVELFGDRKARVRASLQTEGCGPQQLPVEQPQPRCERSAVMVRGRSWVNIAVCPYLHSSLTYHRNIENKVWEIHIFIKKRVPSFIEVHELCLIIFPLIYVCGYTTQVISKFILNFDVLCVSLQQKKSVWFCLTFHQVRLDMKSFYRCVCWGGEIKSRLVCGYLQKMLNPFTIPLQWQVRCWAIKRNLLNKYYLGWKPPGKGQLTLSHPLGANAKWALEKNEFTPKNFWFGLVWFGFFILMAYQTRWFASGPCPAKADLRP